MYQIKYDESKNEIFQIDQNGKITTIASDSPSEPIFSPGKQKAVYISPLEWERLGSLYLYVLENGYITELISPDNSQNTPKFATWIDDDNIVVIIGFGMGTIQVGGNVFIYNIPSQTLKQITTYPPEIQITKVIIRNENLELIGIKYIDEGYNEFKEFNEELPLNRFN